MRVFLAVLALGWALASKAESAAVLLYEITEPGVDAYPSRIIVTKTFLRMDQGTAEGGFLLFDRQERQIYNVTPADATVLVIAPRPVEVEPPFELALETVRASNDGAPPIAGRKPEHYRLMVNGVVCREVVAVPGMAEEATSAIGELREVMAGMHASLLLTTPADVLIPCNLAHDIYAPARHLQWGLPVQLWGKDGRGEVLLDFDLAWEADPELFRIPDEYERYALN